MSKTIEINGDTNIAKDEWNVERVVKKRYAEGAAQREAALCCPTQYDPKFLKVISKEILLKDYGCGDPSQYIREGEVVLDLGSGAGKICFIASQVTGPKGRVIGVDFNPAMLGLATKYHKEIAQRIGWDNVSFKWGRIQDLRTDLASLENLLSRKPVASAEDLFKFEEIIKAKRHDEPMIADSSVDVIVSNCVLNLVETEKKTDLFKEMFRVLKRGGRVAISDIVSDEAVPEHLRKDPDLWSGCISGAFQENKNRHPA